MLERALFWLLPLTGIALLGGIISLPGVLRLSARSAPAEFWSGLSWVLSGPLLTPLVWLFGAPLFGWELGGLGGQLYLWFALPLNGLLVGLLSLPIVGRMLRPLANRNVLAAASVAALAQSALQFAQLGLLSNYSRYVGNLSA